MAKLALKILFLFVLLILFSIQGSTSLEQTNQIQPNQRQIKKEELSRNLKLNPDFGKIPLYFIPNQGQVDEKALFYAKASRYTLWLTKEGLVFDSTRRTKKESTHSKRLSPEDINNHEDVKYDRDVSRLVFLNAKGSPEVIPVDDTEHNVNYFIGNDKSKWRTNIQTSQTVLYKELYPNIDLKVYGIERQIEYDFVVKPGGEVSDISFEYKDVKKTRIDKEDNLVIETRFGELKHAEPVSYQVIERRRIEVEAEFREIGERTYKFSVEEYNRDYDLIIDPLVLVYSTYLGGSSYEWGHDIAVDSEGAAYITGRTHSTDFPTQNAYQGTKKPVYQDAFVTKFSTDGTSLVYSTYLGGSDDDDGYGIAVDDDGAAYITGGTKSTDFPAKNAYQGAKAGATSAYIAKCFFPYSLTISAGSGGTTNPAPGIYFYDKKTEVTVRAIPNTHYRFACWSGDISGTDNPITITVDTNISITASFSRFIYSPLNFIGQKVFNRSLSQAEYINFFSWQSNPNNVDIVKYRIYLIEGESKSLLVELNANTFQYWHRRVEKDKQYTYAICAVNDESREGDPALITVQ